MFSIGTVINLIISICCAVISGVVLWKIQDNKKDTDHKHHLNAEASVKDRELILAIAEVTELTARKIDGDGINGELKAAVEDLVEKRDEVQRFTRIEYFEMREAK